jgi:predicted anti-sigma-YlaC factor YlaD
MRELVSAELDDEISDDERQILSHHLQTCADCAAFSLQAGGLHRRMRVSVAPDVPDLSPAIMANIRPPAMLPLLARYVLLLLGVVTLAVALPDLWNNGMSEMAHGGRHLGGWDIAFSIGLIIVAVQPHRARGLLPMAAALVGVMVASAVVDVVGGHTPGMAESTHALELLQLFVLYLVARTQPRPRRQARSILRPPRSLSI